MTADLALLRQEEALLEGFVNHFPIIQNADPKTQWRFLDFFTSTIKNANTREAYARAVRYFLTWVENSGVARLEQIKPFMVAAYVANLEAAGALSPPSSSTWRL